MVVQLWFELYRPPSSKEAELLEEVLASWFMLGRLGAYNTQNLQVASPASCLLAKGNASMTMIACMLSYHLSVRTPYQTVGYWALTLPAAITESLVPCKQLQCAHLLWRAWWCLERGIINCQMRYLNSQAFYAAGEDMSYMDYDAEECDTGMQATFHDMSQMELQDNWARCW